MIHFDGEKVPIIRTRRRSMGWMQGTLNRTGHPSRILTNELHRAETVGNFVLFQNTLEVGS
jgi:hypothetical protein